MSKLTQMLTKGSRFLYVSAKMRFNFSDKLMFEKIPSPIYLRKKTSDIPTFHQIFTFKDYDINLDFTPVNIIDAGANIGLAAVFFATKFPSATIVCVEPEKSNFGMIEKNTAGYSNIHPLKRAISNVTDLSLNVVDSGGGNWSFTTQSTENTITGKVIDKVETISIGKIMSENKFDSIDILKIDIEGAEKELFESNYEAWLPRTRCLIIELHDGMKVGCSKSFFNAISKYDFSYKQRGENLIFINTKMN